MTSRASGLLLVHAHPDDESINNGVTMAAAVDAGVPVTLVTCTRGEEGEVIPDRLARLASDRDDTLGAHREGELAAAMAALGVDDHRLLGGGARRWRDSGMLGTPQNERADAFWQADRDVAAEALAEIIREVRPETLITYDEQGGYGHPDHIQAHRVAMRAVALAAAPGLKGQLPHLVPRVLWNCVPRSAAERELTRLREQITDAGLRASVGGLDDIPGVVDDAEAAVQVVATERQSAAKIAAMRAHVTQIEVTDLPEPPSGDAGPGAPTPAAAGAFRLSNDVLQPLWSTEYYRLAAGSLPQDGEGLFQPLTHAEPGGPAAATGGGGGEPRSSEGHSQSPSSQVAR